MIDIFAVTCSCPGVSAKIYGALRKAGIRDAYAIPVISNYKEVVDKLTPLARINGEVGSILSGIIQSKTSKFSYVFVSTPPKFKIIDVNAITSLELTAVLEAIAKWQNKNH